MINSNPFTKPFLALIAMLMAFGILFGLLISNSRLFNLQQNHVESTQLDEEIQRDYQLSELEYIDQERAAQAEMTIAEALAAAERIKANSEKERALTEAYTDVEIQRLQEEMLYETTENDIRLNRMRAFSSVGKTVLLIFGIGMAVISQYVLFRFLKIKLNAVEKSQENNDNWDSLEFRRQQKALARETELGHLKPAQMNGKNNDNLVITNRSKKLFSGNIGKTMR